MRSCSMLFVALVALVALASTAVGQAPPAPPDERDPVALWRSLGPADRLVLEEEKRVLTFAHEEGLEEGDVRLSAFSLGVLELPPRTIVGLLARTSDYPDWVPLNPSYKVVRMSGSQRMVAEVGRASARRSNQVIRYDVLPEAEGARWIVAAASSRLEPGSSLAFRVAAHPDRPGVSLVSHEQVARLPTRGRLKRYLASDDDEGRNRFWKDANRHARRLHWAMDSAVRHGGSSERFGLYVEHFQREFGGKLPYWAD